MRMLLNADVLSSEFNEFLGIGRWRTMKRSLCCGRAVRNTSGCSVNSSTTSTLKMPARWEPHTTVLMITLICRLLSDSPYWTVGGIVVMFYWTVASIGLFELTEGLSLSVAGWLGADHPAGPGRSRPTPRRLHQEVSEKCLNFTLKSWKKWTGFMFFSLKVKHLSWPWFSSSSSREILDQQDGTIEDDGLTGLLRLATSVLKHKPPFKFSREGQEFLRDVHNLLFLLPSLADRAQPKCKSHAARAAAYDLLVETVKGSVENYRLLHNWVMSQHMQGEKAS